MSNLLAWVRFGVTAFFVLAALAVFVSETLGIFRFSSMLCRMHAAAMGDTVGMLAAVLAAVTARGLSFAAGKFLAVWLIMAVGGSAASHLLARLECMRAGKGALTLPLEEEPSPEKGQEKEADENDRQL